MTIPTWLKYAVIPAELFLVGTCAYRLHQNRPTSIMAGVADLTTVERLTVPNGMRPVTAVCNDGSTSHSLHRRGTCSRHGGVESWGAPEYGDGVRGAH